jgi:hypothetical protein
MINETERNDLLDLKVDPIQLLEDTSATEIIDCLNFRADKPAILRAFVHNLIDKKYLSRSEGQSCINIGDLIDLWPTR